MKTIAIIDDDLHIGDMIEVNMLMAGASDYITKPFDIRELLARIAAQLRTSGPISATRSYELGRLRLDTMSHDVTYDLSLIHI